MPRLVGVYNADGGLLGELGYVIGKLRGTVHCALCDISHGRRVTAKGEWTAALERLPMPMVTVHRNEMDDLTATVIGGNELPVVVYLEGADGRILLTPADLERCDGDPDALVRAVDAALGRPGLPGDDRAGGSGDTAS